MKRPRQVVTTVLWAISASLVAKLMVSGERRCMYPKWRLG